MSTALRPPRGRDRGRLGVAIWLLWVLCALTMVSAGLGMVFKLLGPGWSRLPRDAQLQSLLYGASAVPFALMGALVTTRRPGNRIGLLLVVVGLSTGLSDFANEYLRYQTSRPGGIPPIPLVTWLAGWVWAPGLAAVTFLMLLYPEGRVPSRAWRPVAWAVGVFFVVAVAATMLVPTVQVDESMPPLDNPTGLSGPAGEILQRYEELWGIGLVVLLLLAAGSLLARFRRARGVERQQLKWLTYTATVTATLFILVITGLPAAGVVATLALWGFPVAIAVAVLKYRLYDIDRLINRTLVYGLVTAVLGGVYAATVLVLGQLFGEVGEGPPSWAVAGATLAVAALFQPARHRIQVVVDRRFNRRKYDAAMTIEAFSARLRDEVDLDTLSAELLAVVDQAMQPTKASLWLRPSTKQLRSAA